MTVKWRTVSIYKPLSTKIEQMIESGEILYPNVGQFINAVVERSVQEILNNQNDSE